MLKKSAAIILALALMLSLTACKSKPKGNISYFDSSIGLIEFYSTDLKTEFAENFYTNLPKSVTYQYQKGNARDIPVTITDHNFLGDVFEALNKITVKGEYFGKDIPDDKHTYSFMLSEDTMIMFEFYGNYLFNEDRYHVIEGYEDLKAISFPGYGGEIRKNLSEAFRDGKIESLLNKFEEDSPVYVSYSYTNKGQSEKLPVVNVEDSAFINRVYNALLNIVVIGNPQENISAEEIRKYTFTMKDGTKYTFTVAGDYIVIGGKYYYMGNSDNLSNIVFPGFNSDGNDYVGETADSYIVATPVTTKTPEEIREENKTEVQTTTTVKPIKNPEVTTGKMPQQTPTKRPQTSPQKPTKAPSNNNGGRFEAFEGDIDDFD